MAALKVIWRNNRFYARGTIKQRRITKSLGTVSKKVAQELCAKLEAAEWERERGHQIHTFASAALDYMEDGGENRFLTPIIDYFGLKPLSEVTAVSIRHAAKVLYPDAMPSTRNRQVIVPARAIINQAADKGYCTFIKVKRFAETPPKTTAVDRSWIDTFCSKANPNLSALALFMFTTGTRIGEALSLTWSEVDVDKRTALLIDTKNGTNHTVRIVEDLLTMLGNGGKPDERVFGYKYRGKVYGPWRTACTRAGIPYVPPHQAGRHSFATALVVRNGIDIATVARLGNWKSKSLLLERYAHGDEDLDIIDAVFSS